MTVLELKQRRLYAIEALQRELREQSDRIGVRLSELAEEHDRLLGHVTTLQARAPEARVIDPFVPSTCPSCRGTGGGQYNDCATCGGNGVV